MRNQPLPPLHVGRKLFLLLVSVACFAAAIFGIRVYQTANQTVSKMYHKSGTPAAASIRQQKPTSILILGADTGALGRKYQGRTDSMILATVNPQTKKITLNSIPRDTLSEMVGTKNRQMNKLNAAYAIDGVKMAVNSTKKLLGVPVDYYVTVNMGAVKKLVNDVNGVTVKVPFSFNYEGTKYKKGTMHLNGKQALNYSRMRYDDPNGDYGRQKRQRQVITAMIKKMMQPAMVSQYDKIMQDVEQNVKTNLTNADFKSLVLHYRKAATTIESDHLQGQNATLNGASYQIAATTELQRLSDKIRKELNLQTKTLNNAETYENAQNPEFDGSTVTKFTVVPLPTQSTSY